MYKFIAPKLSTRHFGFLKGRTTITQLLLFLSEAYYANEKNIELYAFYLDFAKAFDTVPHHLILRKLRLFGIGGNLLKLIHSYLIGRKQFVERNGTSSTFHVIISGVPQGYILGPLLFLVFIDNSPNSCSESLMFLFADDCKSISWDLPALERDFHNCFRWAKENLMTFNLSKTNFIAFGKSSPGLSLNIEKTAIPASNTVKDLGLTINSNLSWSSHIELKVISAHSIFYNLKRSMPPNTHWHTKITLFKSYILSTVLYASEIWCPSKTDLTRLELLQSRVLKWAFPGSNYKERLSHAKMLPISLEIQLRSLILLKRLLNGFYNNFPILPHISFTIPNSGAYNTRLSEKPMFHLPKVKKTRTTHDFFYRVPKLVNYFHANTNLDIFKNPASFKYTVAAEFNKLLLLNISNLNQLHI